LSSKLNINENFICRIWEAGELFYSNLITTENEPVDIITIGSRNYDAGPDYKNAKIRIGGRVYTGDVEIHRDFKSWEEHDHHRDSKYNSVILQVVLWDNASRQKPKLRIKRDLPTIILSDHLKFSIHDIWREIINNPSARFKLPCYEQSDWILEKSINDALDKLSMERLKLKMKRIKDNLEHLHMEMHGVDPSSEIKRRSIWEQAFYEFIFEALGYSKNKDPMLKLAKNLKLSFIKSILKKSNSNEHVVVQALLYGFGGLLFDLRINNEYIEALKNIWSKFKKRAKTEHVNKTEWQFFRMRPQNFPTVRLAYGSQFIMKLIRGDLLREIILTFQMNNFKVRSSYSRLIKLLLPYEDVYWSYNYNFGKSLKKPMKLLGKQRINDITINVIIPFVYYYSLVFANNVIKKNVLEFYRSLKIISENSVISVIQNQLIKGRKISINTPAKEQGAIQLYNFYCAREKCRECMLGRDLVKEKGYEYRIIFY
jgi:hypothetical protein